MDGETEGDRREGGMGEYKLTKRKKQREGIRRQKETQERKGRGMDVKTKEWKEEKYEEGDGR